MKCVVCDSEFTPIYKRKTCSALCSGRSRNKSWFEVNDQMTKLNIDFMPYFEMGCSPGMIFDMLKRDFKLEKITLTQLRSYLKRNFKFDFDSGKNNRQPQWWKLQYKYPKSFTEQQIKADITKKCRAGQLQTIEKRTLKGNNGNPKFKKEDSPLCLEFYISRGLTEEEARRRMLRIQVAGAIAAQKSECTGLEDKVEKLFLSQGKRIEKQFKVKLLPEECVHNKNCYIFDFYLPDENMVVECNGAYWHASPSIYKSGDLIKLPRFGEVKVDLIWAIDEHKKQVALNRGYQYKVIWENDKNLFE